MSVNDLTTLVSLAEQFGPFLFAILFILVVTRTAHQWYREAVTRSQHANPAEIRTLRLYFVLSVYCGIGAMLLSVGWWFYAQTRGMYYYQFSIAELQNDDQINSQYFNKTVPMPLVEGTVQLRDEYFLIGQPTPFSKGQKFTIQYFRLPNGTGANTGSVITPQDLTITYSGNSTDAFKLTAQSGQPPALQLTQVAPDAAERFLALRNFVAFAQTVLSGRKETTP